jgi:hypothetical protein
MHECLFLHQFKWIMSIVNLFPNSLACVYYEAWSKLETDKTSVKLNSKHNHLWAHQILIACRNCWLYKSISLSKCRYTFPSLSLLLFFYGFYCPFSLLFLFDFFSFRLFIANVKNAIFGIIRKIIFIIFYLFFYRILNY